MDNTKLLRYSLQLSMLKQLLQLKLISEKEYQLIEKTIKKVRQNIENCLTFLNQSYTYYSIRKTKKQTAKKYKLV